MKDERNTTLADLYQMGMLTVGHCVRGDAPDDVGNCSGMQDAELSRAS